MKINDTAKLVIDTMISSNLIPETGSFDITEELIYKHRRLYSSFGNGFHHSLKNARRMSGKSLLWLKKQRTKEIKEGFVYLITNPAWVNHTKVGVTTDISARLSTYQTSDPFRSFKVSNFEFVLDRKLVEKSVLEECKIDLENGEWINTNDTTNLIQSIRKHIHPIVIDYSELYFSDEQISIGDIVKFKIKNNSFYGTVNRFTPKRIEILGFNSKTYRLEPHQLQYVKRA